MVYSLDSFDHHIKKMLPYWIPAEVIEASEDEHHYLWAASASLCNKWKKMEWEVLATVQQFELRMKILEEILVAMVEHRALCPGICTAMCLTETGFYLRRNWPICNSR